MIKCELIEVSGMMSAFKALRLPHKNQEKSITDGSMSREYKEGFEGPDYVCFKSSGQVDINVRDLELVGKLIAKGDEHAKVMRGVMAYVMIDAPRYFWQEMSTYKVGVECLSSESTIYAIHSKGITDSGEIVRIKSELPEGTMQKRLLCFSYQALRRIYLQRDSHVLPEWGEFCCFIEQLPLADELITLKGIKTK